MSLILNLVLKPVFFLNSKRNEKRISFYHVLVFSVWTVKLEFRRTTKNNNKQNFVQNCFSGIQILLNSKLLHN